MIIIYYPFLHFFCYPLQYSEDIFMLKSNRSTNLLTEWGQFSFIIKISNFLIKLSSIPK